MKRMILTENGNLLRFHGTLKKGYFQSPRGEFLRECSNDEFDWLCKEGIDIEVNDSRFDDEPSEFPVWHFLKSVTICDDFYNFRSETSSNGGNYSFTTIHDWFVAKYPDGKWKFAFVERYSTSADFSYDELAGKFQSDLGEIYLSNVEGNFRYQTQIGRVWDEDNQCWFSSIPEEVEKIGAISDFETLWSETYQYIPSKFEDDEYEVEFPALSLTDKKEIILKMRSLGFPRNNKNFRQGNNRR